MEQFATEAEVMRAAADRTDDTNADVNREIDRIQQVAEATAATGWATPSAASTT